MSSLADKDGNQQEGSCLKRFKFLDYFKYNGTPKHIAGYQASITGVIGTIILLLITGGYIANSTVRFFTTPPQTSVTQNPTENDRMQFVKTCFSIPHLNNPRYFSRAIWRITLNSTGGKVGNGTMFEMYPEGENKACIYSNQTENFIRAFCKPGNCDFLRFKLWNCGCPDANNPERQRNQNDPADCEPLDKITEVLNKNYVDVAYDTELAQVVQHTSPKIEASAVYITSFAINRTQINPDLVRAFTTQNIQNLVFSRETYHLQYFFPQKGPFKEVLELQMSMSSHVLVTVENRQTALDMIGSWGAFFSVIAGAGAALFGKYNEKKFYERNPKWERIDEHFKVEEGSDATLENEAKGLMANETTNANLYYSSANVEGFGRVSARGGGNNNNTGYRNVNGGSTYNGTLLDQ